uniref:Uncharacterized protein n=1 Tax=Romanomermis culicivorax TaxID=13658 RepID=A0A915IDK6_ROMCU
MKGFKLKETIQLAQCFQETSMLLTCKDAEKHKSEAKQERAFASFRAYIHATIPFSQKKNRLQKPSCAIVPFYKHRLQKEWTS